MIAALIVGKQQVEMREFAEPIPPPMYNDIWAMAHPLHGKLRIEGDTMIFWQNLRALFWMLAIMRQI